jgi:hypothetical protein
MIYQRKPALNSLGVYGVAQRVLDVAPPRNLLRSAPPRRRMAGLSFHGLGASFGADGDYTPWDITQTYTDTTDPYNPTPTDTSTQSTDSGSTSTYQYGPGSTYYQTNTPGLGTGGSGSSGTPSTSSGGTSTQDWFGTGQKAAQGTFDLVGGILKTFGIGGAGTQGTGKPAPGNSMISITVLGAVVLGAGALYLASSRKKA